mmetsp:Transcript_40206/g.73594  ORF Transcript_40206/g.73594 Transcript_40206/m.73594 type:complete len:86 (+) Transcript_40206:196-453(+)
MYKYCPKSRCLGKVWGKANTHNMQRCLLETWAKRTSKTCSHDGCSNYAIKGEVYIMHGGSRSIQQHEVMKDAPPSHQMRRVREKW